MQYCLASPESKGWMEVGLSLEFDRNDDETASKSKLSLKLKGHQSFRGAWNISQFQWRSKWPQEGNRMFQIHGVSD